MILQTQNNNNNGLILVYVVSSNIIIKSNDFQKIEPINFPYHFVSTRIETNSKWLVKTQTTAVILTPASLKNLPSSGIYPLANTISSTRETYQIFLWFFVYFFA
jgi:hypothetical protein